MKLGIMQPYFFPYIGYWQLIHATDVFVLLDDVQYMRHGWINRNRILKPDEGWQYVMVPLEKHAMTATIREVRARQGENWRQRVLGQIDHYRKRTRFFPQVRTLLTDALATAGAPDISHINLAIVRHLCRELGLERDILLSSEMGFDYEAVADAGEWALRIAQQMHAAEYINPIGGAALFEPGKFHAAGTRLRFLKPHDIVYAQGREPFEPALSIIDVLMCNGLAQTRTLLTAYDLEEYGHG